MTFDPHTVTHVLALAANLEGEGQINNAKLLRAAVDSILTRASRQVSMSKEREAMAAQTAKAIDALAQEGVDPVLLQAIERSRISLAEGRLAHYHDTPDPYICRTCGHVMLENMAACPECGAHPASLKRIRAVHWLEAFDPFESLEYLRATPKIVGALLDGESRETSASLSDGGWSLQQAVSHLSDAQGVLEYRVNLILDQHNPVLESKAVFEWAANDDGRPPTVHEIYEAYCASRERTVARLESIPLESWWRRGIHEEFGELKLYEQVSYFASHEIDHLPQIERLVDR